MSKEKPVFGGAWIATGPVAPWWEFLLARLLGKRISLWPGNLMYEWRGKTYVFKNEPLT